MLARKAHVAAAASTYSAANNPKNSAAFSQVRDRRQSRAICAETVAEALGGRKSGAGWMARCPAHEDRTPSLSIRGAVDGKILVRCHAGCNQDAVIAALRARGVWESDRRSAGHPMLRADFQPAADPNCDALNRTEAALAVWRISQPAKGTLVQTYLASRGLHFRPGSALRFHPGLKHPAGGIWPAMIALVTHASDDTPQAIHRTFLARDGSGKAPVEPVKMMLGPLRGGIVRLADPGDLLMVGEGIETCLAAMQASGHAAWAALSASGLRALDLPERLRDVIILADGDEAGETAAQHCARRWLWGDRRVRIARPPWGMDFNDLLIAQAPRNEEATP